MTSRTGKSNAIWIALMAGLAATIGLSAGAASAGAPSGRAFVDAVDPAKATIVLRGERYRVATSAEMTGTKGQPVRLSDLRPVPEGLVEVSTNEADIVAWEAVKGPNGWAITALRVLDDMPE